MAQLPRGTTSRIVGAAKDFTRTKAAGSIGITFESVEALSVVVTTRGLAHGIKSAFSISTLGNAFFLAVGTVLVAAQARGTILDLTAPIFATIVPIGGGLTLYLLTADVIFKGAAVGLGRVAADLGIAVAALSGFTREKTRLAHALRRGWNAFLAVRITRWRWAVTALAVVFIRIAATGAVLDEVFLDPATVEQINCSIAVVQTANFGADDTASF